MLKRFFLNLLSSFTGTMLALMTFGAAIVIVAIGMVGKFGVSSAAVASVQPKSALVIELNGSIDENETTTRLDMQELMMGKVERPQALNVILEAIREASANKRISAIYLKCGAVAAAPATLQAIRAEIEKFRKEGKPVYAYGSSYTQGAYYVATAASKVLLNPQGTVDLKGVGGTSLFFKDLLDNLGIRVTALKVGTYKSAVEPYIQNEMSAPARAQLDTLYGGIWSVIKADIASARKIKADRIDTLINRDNISMRQAAEFLKLGLVDKLVYEREVDGIIASAIGVDKEKLNYVDVATVVGPQGVMNGYGGSRQIAVLYAAGEIQELEPGGINCFELVPVITRLAEDDNVKGLVLRVNSPGGSVFGSEQIREALQYFKSKKKPLVVSMGDYAASGGYWISASADRIFANPLTITGSIGIFGLIPDAEGLINKIGVHAQTVSTNPEATFPNLFAPMTPGQHQAMQQWIEKGYDRFISIVAKGRKMKESKVRQIAEGRVWGAKEALKIGLVDQLGTTEDAIKWVASKADLADNYEVSMYPQPQASIWGTIIEASGMEMEIREFAEAAGGNLPAELQRWAWRLLRQDQKRARMVEIDLKL